MHGAWPAESVGGAYLQRRERVETYFDRTAADAWARLTSDAPVGRIRATVRAGRATMRDTLLDWLPDDLSGRRVLDAGCGTGTLAVEAARRGAEVVAVDLSRTLVELARERYRDESLPGTLRFHAGDMLDPGFGSFDHLVAMDSLIHYTMPQLIGVMRLLSARVTRSILFTFAPATLPLAVMHAAGRLFPRANRSPAIEPVPEATLRRRCGEDGLLHAWRWTRTQRVQRGFYTSQAVELACA